MYYRLFRFKALIKSARIHLGGRGHVDNIDNFKKVKYIPGKRKILRDKVAMVTGGASGIGREIVREFLEAGAMGVSIADINHITGEQLAQSLAEEFGKGKTVFVKCDIRKSSNFDWAYKQTLKSYKQLDVVVNNAGMLNDPKWETTISTNIGGCVIGSLLGVQYMSKSCVGSGGHVINIASTCGLICSSGLPIYSMTQSAIIGFGRALGDSDQYDRSGVKVITLCITPGFSKMKSGADVDEKFNYEIFDDMENMMVQKPKDIAKAVMTLLTKANTGSVWVARTGEPPYEARLPEQVEDLKVGH
ncbi:15-hydroxyprostaglandin dehydrogenase [NAD(+)]-like [Onthophagus taurus]|uniref:15-hydroxyprostaglandin dehydrogenase [NAD(+)]-like n=1 Tax=Onthophagus taurus TaxID=166361 RepID=UPI000C201F27|nr:15-hydroxyprostaglandin dehydrogenase [NAD(+)]-like [Onthophagus taurus]